MLRNPWNIAIQFDLPGKGSKVGCAIFARALFNQLVDNETPCCIIQFHWVGVGEYNKGTEDTHDIIVYEDEQNRLYSIDAMAVGVTRLPDNIEFKDIPQWLNKDTSCSNIGVIDKYGFKEVFSEEEVNQQVKDQDSNTTI